MRVGVVVVSRDIFMKEKLNASSSLQLIIWFVCQLVIYRAKELHQIPTPTQQLANELLLQKMENISLPSLLGRGVSFFLYCQTTYPLTTCLVDELLVKDLIIIIVFGGVVLIIIIGIQFFKR